MRHFLLATVASLVVVGSPAFAQPAQGKLLDYVVATVNDDIILFSELTRRVGHLAPRFSEISDSRERARRQARFSQQVLKEMINDTLIVQAATEAQLTIKPREIRTTIEELKKQNGLNDSELTEALALQGYTMHSYQEELRQQLLRARAINTFVRSKVQITNEAIRARYDEISQRSGTTSQVRLYHILIQIPPSASAAQITAARDRAAAVMQRARSGESFSALAKELSDDADTKDGGGDLGWLERGSIATDWETVVFAMRKGEVRGPIKGAHGFHIFQVADTKTTAVKSFKELKKGIKKQLQNRELERQTQIWLKTLRDKAHIVVTEKH